MDQIDDLVISALIGSRRTSEDSIHTPGPLLRGCVVLPVLVVATSAVVVGSARV